MLRVIHVRVIVDSLSFFIVLKLGGYLVMFSAYIRRFLSPLSLAFLFFLLQTCFQALSEITTINTTFISQFLVSSLSVLVRRLIVN